uniref:hypothetical protein n=1 Tax=Amycolatopsis sp. CA-096443 TaxID=3239919 RepID=UPI003F4944D2
MFSTTAAADPRHDLRLQVRTAIPSKEAAVTASRDRLASARADEKAAPSARAHAATGQAEQDLQDADHAAREAWDALANLLAV